ncbi:MAG: hypothetical protein QM776_13525 [Rhodocyclaceae bacterium]
MVSPINQGTLLERLRRQLATRAARSEPGTELSSKSEASLPAAQIVPRRRQAQDYLLALDPSDPAYFRKARTLFLQLVLADAFGDLVAGEADFGKLVQSVEQLLDEDPVLNQAFEVLFAKLRQR